MPEFDGIELLRRVRDEYPNLPFILFTAQGSESVASDAISAGVTDYLQKKPEPGQYSVLARQIENTVEQRWSREELTASRKRLSLFIEQSPLGVIECNSESGIVRLNPKAKEILGYAEQELRGKCWQWLTKDPVRGEYGVLTERIDAEDSDTHQITETVTKSGEELICEWHERTVSDEDDELVAQFILFQDVTARIRREQKLDQVQQRTESLIRTKTVQDTAEVAVTAANDIIGASLSGVHPVNSTDDELQPVAFADAVSHTFEQQPPYPQHAEAGSRAALVWDCFTQETPLRIDDTDSFERLSESTPAGSVLVHPLGEHGVFIVSSRSTHSFTSTDETLVEILSTTLSAALDRIKTG